MAMQCVRGIRVHQVNILIMDPWVIAQLLLRLDETPELKSKLLALSNRPETTSEAEQQVQTYLQELANAMDSLPSTPLLRATRVYMASCMDIIHSGHFNCMRQAKALGDILVMGVIADEEIRRCKGPPVMNQDERAAMIEACRWVDEVIVGVEYYVTPEILERVGCDFVAHGDDVAIRKDTGKDAYEDVRNAGKLKIVKRTEGISTTDLIGKMMLMTRAENHDPNAAVPVSEIVSHDASEYKFLATTRRLTQFAPRRSPLPTDRVVYIDGGFDMIHKGHVETLKRAKALGDYLIVGVHDDRTVNLHKGKNYPIMNLHERTLNLLALKSVDDVIMGAPWALTEDMLRTLNIQIVAQGTNPKTKNDIQRGSDPYAVAKEKGIYTEVESVYPLDTEDIVERIVANRLSYSERNKRMEANQKQYYENKTFVAEI